MSSALQKWDLPSLFSNERRLDKYLIAEIGRRSEKVPFMILQTAARYYNVRTSYLMKSKHAREISQIFQKALCSEEVLLKLKRATKKLPFDPNGLASLLSHFVDVPENFGVELFRCIAMDQTIAAWYVYTRQEKYFIAFSRMFPKLARNPKFRFPVAQDMSNFRAKRIVREVRMTKQLPSAHVRFLSQRRYDQYGQMCLLSGRYASDMDSLENKEKDALDFFHYADSHVDITAVVDKMEALQSILPSLSNFPLIRHGLKDHETLHSQTAALHKCAKTLCGSISKYTRTFRATQISLAGNLHTTKSNIHYAHLTYFWRVVVLAQAFLVNGVQYNQEAIDKIIAFAAPFISDCIHSKIQQFLYARAHRLLMSRCKTLAETPDNCDGKPKKRRKVSE